MIKENVLTLLTTEEEFLKSTADKLLDAGKITVDMWFAIKQTIVDKSYALKRILSDIIVELKETEMYNYIHNYFSDITDVILEIS